MSQNPQTPRHKKVQDALDLFAQLQGVPFVVVDDEQRVRHAAALQKDSAAPPTAKSGSSMLKKGSGSGGGAAPSLATTKQLHQQIADLQRKISLSDAIMRKLHKKNRELLAQLEGAEGPLPSGDLSSDQLKAIIAKRDQEIASLKRQLSSQTQAAPVDAPAPRAESSRDRTPRTITKGTIEAPTNAPADAQILALHKRVDTLQKDYQTLMDSKLDTISQGESTGKVNKQVKAFFSAVKAKLASDTADYEAERALWLQRLPIQ